MEQPNNIDQLFRQRLQQAEVPPPAFVWNNVERALQGRKRRAFLWLFALSLSGLGLWALWTFSTPATAPDSQPAVYQPAFAPAQETSAPVAGQTHAPELSPETTLNSAEPAGPESSRLTSTQKESGLLKTALNPSAGRIPGNATSAPKAGAARSPKNLEVNPKMATTPLLAADVIPAGPSREQTAKPTAGYVDMLPDRLAALDIPEELPVLSPIALPALKKKPKKCYDFHTNRQAWLFDVYTGPSFVRKSLYAGDPEFKSYVQDRFATEKRDFAFHAGLRASYLFAENLIIRTGLHYEQFTEQFEYIDPNYIQYNISVTQKLINGQWETVIDTTDIQYGANYVKTYNRFSLLDIPLQAALELRSGATGVSLNLGGSVNVLFRQRGSILTPDGKPAYLKQYPIFEPKVGLSLLGSIQWFYHLTPRTRLFAEPYYRHILEPVSRAGYPVEQSYGIGGIRLGLTKIFD